MRRDLCTRLCCPEDGGGLILETSEASQRIEEGFLLCSVHDEHRYQIREGIPDFRAENFDHLAGDEPPEFGTVVTPAVAKRVHALASDWTLDAGCARGAYRPYVSGRYVGIDLIRPFLTEARELYPDADFLAGDIRRLPFKARVFDLVVSSQVLEHLTEEDLDAAVLELMRTCRGHLVIDTPNESLVVTWMRHLLYGQEAAGMHDTSSPLAHHTRITPAMLRRLGFTVEGCVGHVSRARFRWPRSWDAYDRLAARFPWSGTNLIGIASLHTRHDSLPDHLI